MSEETRAERAERVLRRELKRGARLNERLLHELASELQASPDEVKQRLEGTPASFRTWARKQRQAQEVPLAPVEPALAPTLEERVVELERRMALLLEHVGDRIGRRVDRRP